MTRANPSGLRALWPTGEAMLALYVGVYLAVALAGAPMWWVIGAGALGVTLAVAKLIRMEMEDFYGR